jgi:hypothetical protein
VQQKVFSREHYFYKLNIIKYRSYPGSEQYEQNFQFIDKEFYNSASFVVIVSKMNFILKGQ